MAAQRTNGRESRQTESNIAFPTQFKSRQKVPMTQRVFYTHLPQPRNPAYLQRAKNGFGCPLRIPELARARPSLRCAPFKYSWCMGGIRCVAIYSFFGAEEMGFGPQRSPTSKYDFELEKRALYALSVGRAALSPLV
jgi:hypothetical protein